MASVFSRAVQMVFVIVGVRWTIPYLGAERFGIWMTIASLLPLLSFLDLGLGNALTNHVARAKAGGEGHGTAQAVSAGLGILALAALAVFVLLQLAAHLVPWQSWLKFSASTGLASSDLWRAMQVFVVMFALNLCATGVQRVYLGLQRAHLTHLMNGAGTMISIALIGWAAHRRAGLSELLGISMLAPVISAGALLLFLRKDGLFSWRALRDGLKDHALRVVPTSRLFFVLQLGTMVAFGVDNVLVSSVHGAQWVADYSVVQRLFQFALQPLAILNAPLWGAYADAMHSGDVGFIRRTLRRSVIGSATVGGLAVGALAVFGTALIAFWTTGRVTPSEGLLNAYAFWVLVQICADSVAMFMNGCGVVRPQIWATCALVFIGLPLKYFCLVEGGLAWMVIVFALFCAVNLAFWYGIVFRRTLTGVLSVAPADAG